MAVLANGGTSSGDVTGSASTQPTAAIVRVRTGSSARDPLEHVGAGLFERDHAPILRTTPREPGCEGPCGTSHPGWSAGSADALLSHVAAQPLAELRAEVLARQGQLDGGAEVVELAADVVATLVERVAVHVEVGEQPPDGVGELDLAAGARLGAVDRLEDRRR